MTEAFKRAIVAMREASDYIIEMDAGTAMPLTEDEVAEAKKLARLCLGIANDFADYISKPIDQMCVDDMDSVIDQLQRKAQE